jgi:hypothetical protein
MAFRANLIGKKFGKITVLEYAFTKKNRAYWKCICDCGTYVFSATGDLNGGKVKTCKCSRREKGEKNNNWKNGKLIDKTGYILTYKPEHPRAKNSKYVREHILVAENVLQRHLKLPECLHHIDENPANNEKSNLVICQNQAYHMFIHQRLRTHKECGNVHWMKCKYCKKYDSKENLYIQSSNTACHRSCHALFEKNRRQKIANNRMGL